MDIAFRAGGGGPNRVCSDIAFRTGWGYERALPFKTQRYELAVPAGC
jgi:hypothetical protein